MFTNYGPSARRKKVKIHKTLHNNTFKKKSRLIPKFYNNTYNV